MFPQCQLPPILPPNTHIYTHTYSLIRPKKILITLPEQISQDHTYWL